MDNSRLHAKAIERIMQFRERKAAINAQAKEKTRNIDEAISKLERKFIAPALRDDALRNISTDFGTAMRVSRHQYALHDRPEFIAWLLTQISNGDREVIDAFTNSLSKSWMDEYVAEHDDLPDGVKRTDWEEVGYRKPTKRKY